MQSASVEWYCVSLTRKLFLATSYNNVPEEQYDFQSHCHSAMEDCGFNSFLDIIKNT